MERSLFAVKIEAYMRAADMGDVGGRIGALKAMLGITSADIDPLKKALSLVPTEKLWRAKSSNRQDYKSVLWRERQVMQQALQLCAFTGFKEEEHERATACVVRVLILELMPEALRPSAKSPPHRWTPDAYMNARAMFEMMQSCRFNIEEFNGPGIGLTRWPRRDDRGGAEHHHERGILMRHR